MKYFGESGMTIHTDQLIGRGGNSSLYYQYHLVGEYSIAATILNVVSSLQTIDSRNKYFRKIKYLCLNKPVDAVNYPLQSNLGWPVELILNETGETAGYTFLYKTNIFSIHKILYCKPSNDLAKDFSLREKGGFYKRLSLCIDLVKTLQTLNQSNNYLYSQLSPDNICVSENNSVFMINIDELSFSTDNELFPPTFYCPEYSAPEVFKSGSLENYCVESNYYSLAILIYEILTNVHPFQGFTVDGDHDIMTLMRTGIFANTSMAINMQKASPHRIFTSLFSDKLENLFIKTFEDGCLDFAKRPNYLNWLDALEEMRKIWENQ